MIILKVIIFSLIVPIFCHANDTFFHGNGVWHYPESSSIENPPSSSAKELLIASKEATHASATSICRLKNINSLSLEVGQGEWRRVVKNKIKYMSSYKCVEKDSSEISRVLEVTFVNQISCVKFGELQAKRFARNKCKTMYGLGVGKMNFGGCIGGANSNHYIFEVTCE